MPSFTADTAVTRPSFIASGSMFQTKAATILKGFGSLVAGTVLGKITASGKYAPCARTTVASTAASGQKDITVVDASGFTAGDTIGIGQSATAGNYEEKPIASIAGNVITMTYNLTYTLSAGDLVRLVDGSEVPRGMLTATTDTGIGTGDDDYIDKDGAIVVIGDIISTKCTGLDAKNRAALVAEETVNLTFSNLG